MPRFPSFTSHVEEIIDKFHQAIEEYDIKTLKKIWLNEENISIIYPVGDISQGIDETLLQLKLYKDVRIEILSIRSHNFAGFIMTETLEAWSNQEKDVNPSANDPDATGLSYVYGTYFTMQSYPDWQLMRAHYTPANQGSFTYHSLNDEGLGLH